MASTSSISTSVSTNKDARPKPKVSTLQTPVSASYPSEIRSPLPGTPAYIKKEENVQTPITPPHAYLDFLKTMSPALLSPAPTGTSSHFSFVGKLPEKAGQETDDNTVLQPSLSRTSSTDSTATVVTIASEGSDASDQSFESTDSRDAKRERCTEPDSYRTKKKIEALDLSKSKRSLLDSKPRPQSPRIVIPPSPFAKPVSNNRLTRRTQVPTSPLSPANIRSPMSARSHHEPRSASCLSATPWSASYPPDEPEANSKTSRVFVRQVVTRTVTYSQTPLDPAPKGKRRKLEE